MFGRAGFPKPHNAVFDVARKQFSHRYGFTNRGTFPRRIVAQSRFGQFTLSLTSGLVSSKRRRIPAYYYPSFRDASPTATRSVFHEVRNTACAAHSEAKPGEASIIENSPSSIDREVRDRLSVDIN